MSAPPGTSSSEPGPTPAASTRPRSRRPRTAARVGTARPDTSASGISAEELPDQQFFPDNDDLSEDEGEYLSDEPEDDVFAFDRPKTGAVPRTGAGSGSESGYGTSAPNTGMTQLTGASGYTTFSGGAGSSVPPLTAESGVGTLASDSVGSPAEPLSLGAVEAGGRVPELGYDFAHPPPFSGRHNLNNSAFAFSVASRRGKTASTDADTDGGLAGTTYTAASQTSFDSHDVIGGGAGGVPGGTGAQQPRRVRSTAPLIPSTAGTGFTSVSGATTTTDRGMTRGSYGMTELTGDMTVPDGKTTWGDGQGGALKDISEQGEDVQVAEYDMTEEDSPYAEVRASVSNMDDPEMPSLTFRAWLLGFFFAIIGAGVNTFFLFRTPSSFINSLIIQVVTYPCGKLLARFMPIHTFRNPRWLGGHEWTLNPGPFNIKEHCIVTIMSNVSLTPGFALWAIVSSELWYQQTFGVAFNILFLLSTQVTGFSLAGLCQRYVVQPASMIWPSALVMSTNLNTLHAEEDRFRGGMTRFRFLMITGGGAFLYYFLPGYLFSALSYFSWICWIAPENRVINQVFGVTSGLGMSIITLDWSQINWVGNPLIMPWWGIVNVGAIFILCYWIIVPILYYTNVWYSAYLPINTGDAIDRFGLPYDIFAILTPERTLNETAYAEYSPIYLSATFSMTYMVGFALVTALISHTALFHGPRIYRAAINVKTEADDIHAKLMKRYPGVPSWWYTVLMVVFGGVMGVVSIEVFGTGLPVWGYLISMLLAAIYLLPSAFVLAMTSQLIAINLIAELLPGYIFSGMPIPCMLFKVVSMQTLQEALIFTQDMKLGHYIKIPPRNTYIAQLTAVLVASFVQIGVKELLFAAVPDMCAMGQSNLLTCGSIKVFFTSTVIWGLIGPRRLFSQGAQYYPQVFVAIIGAVVPFFIWLAARRWPRSFVRNVNLPVGLNGVVYMPPATGVNYASWLIVGTVFQFWLRRRRFAWWSKYNYVLAAALDVGTALSALFIFLILRLPQVELKWWGTQVFQNTADWTTVGAQLYDAPVEGFGPTEWVI